jgi:hypothetical protein
MGWFRIDDPENPPPMGVDVLVWYNHDADPYQDPNDTNLLTDYAVWTEGGDFMDGCGICIAMKCPQHWERVDEYGAGYWMPSAWFSKENDDYERVCNPTHWQALPEAPND